MIGVCKKFRQKIFECSLFQFEIHMHLSEKIDFIIFTADFVIKRFENHVGKFYSESDIGGAGSSVCS